MMMHTVRRLSVWIFLLMLVLLGSPDRARGDVGSFDSHGCCQQSIEDPVFGAVDDCVMVASGSDCTGENAVFTPGGECVQTGGSSTNCSFPIDGASPGWGSSSTVFGSNPLQLATPTSVVAGDDVPALAAVQETPTTARLQSLAIDLASP